MKECWTALTMILFVENNLSESLWILQEKKEICLKYLLCFVETSKWSSENHLLSMKNFSTKYP